MYMHCLGRGMSYKRALSYQWKTESNPHAIGIYYYLLLFIIIYYYLLLFIIVYYCLLLFIVVYCYLLLFIVICCYLFFFYYYL